MNLEINTVTKTIRVLSSTPILEVINFLKDNRWEDWTIEPETKVEWLTPISPYNPYVQQIDPYSPPYTVTYKFTTI